MIKLFSGTSNKPLAEKVADALKIPLSKSEVVRFDDSEVRVRIGEDVKHTTAIVIQSTANPTDTNLMEFFFFCDALRRNEAHKVIGIIPYFGYARQDIQHRPGESISANVVIRFIESIGFRKIYVYDLHDEATEGVFSIAFKNATTFSLLADKVREYLKDDVNEQNVAIVSPDQGGIERARRFGQFLLKKQNFPLVVIEKRRNMDKIHTTEALQLYGDVSGKTAILVDDIVTSGNTLINAVELCISKGAKRVIAVVAHADLSEKAPERIQNSSIEKFFTTDSILLKEELKFAKLEQISIAPLIAEELKTFLK